MFIELGAALPDMLILVLGCVADLDDLILGWLAIPNLQLVLRTTFMCMRPVTVPITLAVEPFSNMV